MPLRPFPKSSPFHSKPSLPYIYFLLKQRFPSESPTRATTETFHNATDAHAALLNYVRDNYPYHRSIEPPAGVNSGVGRVMEGYVAEYNYKDGDWSEEEVVGWAWVEREWGG